MAAFEEDIRTVQEAVGPIHKEVQQIDEQVAQLSLKRAELITAAHIALSGGGRLERAVARCW